MDHVRIIVYTNSELGIFVAQCLEYDICVQAETVSQVKKLLLAQFAFYINEYGDLNRIPPAPDSFFVDWDSHTTQASKLLMSKTI